MHKNIELTVTAQEADRIAALHSLGLLDSAPTEAFDRVTRLAAQALGAPMVLVSLIDENRQWFKSKFGIDAAETPRSVSFCSHAIQERRALIVPDAEKDARFCDNPHVTGDPYVRSYAGIPLYTLTGHAIGTLCAVDVRRREYSDAELNMLRDFALVIEDLVHALEQPQNEVKTRATADREDAFRVCFEHAGLGMMQASLTGNLLRTNARMRALLGYTEAELTGMSFGDITHPDDLGKASAMFQQIVAGTIDRYRLEQRYQRKDGSWFWSDLSLSLKRSDSGQSECVVAIADDISVRKQTEAELLRVRDALRCDLAEQSRRLADNDDVMRRHRREHSG